MHKPLYHITNSIMFPEAPLALTVQQPVIMEKKSHENENVEKTNLWLR